MVLSSAASSMPLHKLKMRPASWVTGGDEKGFRGSKDFEEPLMRGLQPGTEMDNQDIMRFDIFICSSFMIVL